MSTPPPDEVVAAIMAPTSRITRRVEIYESDGITRWNADNVIRAVDGSITVDYSRDERRAIDLTLDNSDGALLNAPGYFWYDKIIKVFRGVSVRQNNRPPSVIIVGGDDDDNQDFRTELVEAGYDNVRINSLATTLADIAGYDIVASIGGGSAAPEPTLLADAYNAGYSVWSQGAATPKTSLPFVTTAASSTSYAHWYIAPNLSVPSELTAGWVAEQLPSGTGILPTAIDATAIAVSNISNTDMTGITIISAVNVNGEGGKWIHFAPDIDYTSNFTAFVKVAFAYLNPFTPIEEWETQIGEFMIDKISEDNFPRYSKITGRDYTKKCITSEFEEATEFDGPSNLEDLIADISALCGIHKKVLPPTGIVVTQTFSYERGATRWSAMKEIANAFNYDIFFDSQGFLRIELQTDPATSSPTFIFKTGIAGNMATYTKSTDDSRLYNHVVVTGGSDDSTVLPPSAEARNDDPTSPTNIDTIGDRLYEYDSTFITTTDQAQAVADSFLAIHALEEFELDFDAIVLAWLEVGETIQWIDPRPAPDDPDTFLLQTLTIPMLLGPMSATAARVVIV